MNKHIVVATDGSEIAQRVVAYGAALAKSLGAKLTIVTVTGTPPDLTHPQVAVHMPQIMHEVAKAAEIHLGAAKAIAASHGVAAETLHVENAYPQDGIIEAAKSRGADLIVMGSHGRSALGSLLLGSVAQKVLAHSTVPVLIHR